MQSLRIANFLHGPGDLENDICSRLDNKCQIDDLYCRFQTAAGSVELNVTDSN